MQIAIVDDDRKTRREIKNIIASFCDDNEYNIRLFAEVNSQSKCNSCI